MTMADRLIVMNAGRPEQIDTPMAVYRHPASLFVDGFIGSPAMNFLAAEIAADGAGAALAGGGRLPLPGSGHPRLRTAEHTSERQSRKRRTDYRLCLQPTKRTTP